MKRTIAMITVLTGLAFFSAASAAANTVSSPVRAAVREYIEANMPWPPGAARVDFLSEATEAAPESMNMALRVEPTGNKGFIGDMVFLVKYFRGGSLVKTESVRARVEVLRDVMIATRPLPAGTIMAEGDARPVSRWVSQIHPQSLASLDAALGKRLTVQVPSGAEILANVLKDAPLVRKGKIVKMVFDNGAMHIITIGLPEEDGVAGTIIRVKNITSNKIIYARVLNDSLVGVEF